MVDRLDQFCRNVKYILHHRYPRLRVVADNNGFLRPSGHASLSDSFRGALLIEADLQEDLPTKAACMVIVEILIEFLETSEVQLPKLFERHDADYLRPIIRALNETIFFDYSLEITSHGLLRSFRFWSHSEKVAYLEMAKELIDDLRCEFGHVSFGYGFVLSFERGGDFMPHDDDVDIIVALDAGSFPTMSFGMDAIVEHLLRKKWECWGDWSTHRKVFREVGKKDVDVFVGIKEDGFVSFLPGPRKTILFADVFPPIESIALGVRCPFPARRTAYLEKVYGPDWREPKPGWQHSWSNQDYEDII